LSISIFFLISADDLSGANLSKTFVDAIPFFPGTIYSNFVFSAIFFGIHVGVKKIMDRSNENNKVGLLSTEGV
jgi:hypothetical protein